MEGVSNEADGDDGMILISLEVDGLIDGLGRIAGMSKMIDTSSQVRACLERS